MFGFCVSDGVELFYVYDFFYSIICFIVGIRIGL